MRTRHDPIPLNLDNVDAWAGGAILSPGNHTVRVVEADDTINSSRNGHPQIVLKLEATDGPETGGTITDWITITPPTPWAGFVRFWKRFSTRSERAVPTECGAAAEPDSSDRRP